jgi:hypothetical protein
MKKDSIILTIAHNLYLTKLERNKLSENSDVEIETVGVTLPVWVKGAITSEPAEEIISRYKVRNYTSPEIESIHVTHDGFILGFDDESIWKPLKEDKSESIYFTHQGKITHKKKEITIINYINIQPIECLIKE